MRLRPQGVIGWKGLGVGNVQPGCPEAATLQSLEQGLLIDGRSPTDIVKDGTFLALYENGLVAEVLCFRAVRQDIDHVIGLSESGRELAFRKNRDHFITASATTIGRDLQAERVEHLGQTFSDGTVAEDEHLLPLQGQAARAEGIPFFRPVSGLALEGFRQQSGLSQHESQRMQGAGFLVHRGAIGDEEAFFDEENFAHMHGLQSKRGIDLADDLLDRVDGFRAV